MRLVFNKHNPEFHWGIAECEVFTVNMPALTNVEDN
jgi:hypothetical protein